MDYLNSSVLTMHSQSNQHSRGTCAKTLCAFPWLVSHGFQALYDILYAKLAYAEVVAHAAVAYLKTVWYNLDTKISNIQHTHWSSLPVIAIVVSGMYNSEKPINSPGRNILFLVTILCTTAGTI